MNTPKRVSFGSKGSMVETWIIYDEKDNQSLTQTDHAETQFQRNILLNTGQEHEYQANHHHTNLQYHQHNHLYEQQHNNNNQEQKYHDEQQQHHHHHEQQQHYQQHNNNNNNNYSHHQQQQYHHLPPSPPPPPPAKSKELRVTFSDSPLCDSRYGEPPSRVSKSASSNCDVDINNLNAAFLRRPIKRSQSLESRDNPFVPGGELAIDTEDILKRATIVRDKFFLEEQEKQKIENEALAQAQAQAQAQDKTDGPIGKDVGKSPDTKGTGKDLPKENGKVEEEKADEQATRPPTGGQTGELQDAPKERKKQKNKCCTIM